MPGETDERNESTIVLIVQLAAILLVFAVPVTVLALAIPQHAQTIILIAVYTLFGIAALFAGIGWREPSYGETARSYTKWVFVFTITAVAASRWLADPDQEIPDYVVGVVIRALILLLPFFLGRFIDREMQKHSKPQR
ncbi:MAG: hypothetical protein M1133_12645 [Armatimonadetes bacterium]|nr:hypothetical protein [Armatimonadota bacterium]